MHKIILPTQSTVTTITNSRAKIGFVLPAVTHSSIRDVLKVKRRGGAMPERHVRSLTEDGCTSLTTCLVRGPFFFKNNYLRKQIHFIFHLFKKWLFVSKIKLSCLHGD